MTNETYTGGKGNSYHRIINFIPPHGVYIEPFLGFGRVMQAKKPALKNIGLDIDSSIIDRAMSTHWPGTCQFYCANALDWLASYDWQGNEFVYCDPPYLMSTRSTQRAYYRNEFSTEHQHKELLNLLLSVPVNIAISGYDSEMYRAMLNGWHVTTWQTVTRSGKLATEHLWMNYPNPTHLHDYSYLGENFTDRQRIKRKKDRWKNKLANLPTLEKQAILWAISESQLT